jgi:molybdopterin/thiamine biosynthesis adenylyltransferase
VLPDWIEQRLLEITSLDVETGGVLLARPVKSLSGDLRLLATELHLVSDEAYASREFDGLQITSDGYVPALARAEELSAIPIWLHTHPGRGASPRPSSHDEVVDGELSDLFRLRAASEFYGALIVAREREVLRFEGFLESEHGRTTIDRLFVPGSRFHLFWNDSAQAQVPSPLYDRNIRAFGGDVQNVLHDLRVAIVGCGGTGSSVAEQLVRLGVRHFLLLDPDVLSDHNVTRVYGSELNDVGSPKVEVIGKHIMRIATDAVVDAHALMVTKEAAARRLADVDVIFGCTDDNAGRLVLSRLPTFMLTPVIDCGVLLTSDGQGQLDGIFGRVTVVTPGSACLVCRDRIDLARAAAEALTPDERIRRVDEGYAPALPGVEPAVVSYTTLVAATAVGELIERFVGYGPPEVPGELLLRVHDRELSTNNQEPRDHHYCHSASSKIGLGITDPFLEQTWQG